MKYIKYSGKIYRSIDFASNELKIVETGLRDIKEVESLCKDYISRLQWVKRKISSGESEGLL